LQAALLEAFRWRAGLIPPMSGSLMRGRESKKFPRAKSAGRRSMR